MAQEPRKSQLPQPHQTSEARCANKQHQISCEFKDNNDDNRACQVSVVEISLVQQEWELFFSAEADRCLCPVYGIRRNCKRIHLERIQITEDYFGCLIGYILQIVESRRAPGNVWEDRAERLIVQTTLLTSKIGWKSTPRIITFAQNDPIPRFRG